MAQRMPNAAQARPERPFAAAGKRASECSIHPAQIASRTTRIEPSAKKRRARGRREIHHSKKLKDARAAYTEKSFEKKNCLQPYRGSGKETSAQNPQTIQRGKKKKLPIVLENRIVSRTFSSVGVWIASDTGFAANVRRVSRRGGNGPA